MDDRYARTMEQAERVMQTVAAHAERSLRTMASKTPEAKAAAKRERQRRKREAARRFKRIMVAIGAILAATMAWGMFVSPVGVGGIMLLFMAMLAAAILLSVYPKNRRQVAEVQALSNAEIVHRLDARLIGERPALPAPALTEVDAISARLPMLEQRLATLNPLDPLAQDARRLMGQHLPDLLDHYGKVPATHRSRREGGEMSIDERLVGGLGAARAALDDIGDKLAQGDLSAFETHGRFLESRYKDGGPA